jgi:glycosyltransferase involved in cell wall biosynthesis
VRIYCDLQATQTPTNPDRGIARYVAEFSRAVEENHPGVVEAWVLNPALPVPAHILPLMTGGAVRSQDDPDLSPPDVWHVLSPFEDAGTGRLLDQVWPRWARTSRTRLLVTLYDVIPLIYPDRYLEHPVARESYMRRLRLVQRADRILAISEATAKDAVRMLDIPPNRIDVVGTGVSEQFVPADDRNAVLARLAAELPRLRPDYVLYTGGIDFRKNIEGLLNAYARLPQPIRTQHQLVIVCSVGPAEREHLEQRARALGIQDDFLLTGYIPDDLLLRIYQAAHLFVFPSLYEGFGLPVVEALSCGVPTIVGRNSSLTELVDDPNAWFDAADADDITRALFRALSDHSFRAGLIQSTDHDYRWNIVAERSLAAYARAVRHRPPQAARPRLALVSPMPPVRSGVADYSSQLLRSLSEKASVDVFTSSDADRSSLPGVRWFRYEELPTVLRLHGDYDDILYAMGNSEHHFECLELLRRHGGTVIAHDVRYTDLFSAALQTRRTLVDNDTETILKNLFSKELPERLRHFTRIDPEQYYRTNDLLITPVAQAADTLFVHSQTAATLARLNLPPQHRSKISILPFGVRARTDLPGGPADTIASFGIVDRIKRSDAVVDAFVQLAQQDRSLRFALVGQCPDEELWAELHERIVSAELAGRITLTGGVDDEEYVRWLGRARLAVQLRARSNGETSAAVADCMGAGIPTIVSRLGAMAELGDACMQIPVSATVADIVRSISELLADPGQLSTFASRGRAHADSHTFSAVAKHLLQRAIAQRDRGQQQDSAVGQRRPSRPELRGGLLRR